MSDCPSPNEIEAFAIGDLSRRSFDRIEQHLEGCVACRHRLDDCERDDEFVREVRELGSKGGEEIDVPNA